VKGADMVEWGFINEAQSILESSDAVQKEFGMKKAENGAWTWNKKGMEDRPYEIPTEAAEVLKRDLQQKDQQKQIPKDLVTLARKILA
tara:strand:+ start:3517 stop:3780 length:264 start_codon:yes stop_codon:yes gene_type:complete